MGVYHVGGLTVEVIEGDITATDVEAITNAANNHLWMGGGVAGAIKRAGGEEIERAAVVRGPIAVGDAVETTAGALPHRYVIHGAVVGQDLQTSADLIARTTTSCLELADRLGVRSLALPSFGTGVGGFPVEEAARLIVAALDDFVPHRQSLERVVLALFGAAAHGVFEGAAQAAWGGEE